VGNRQWADAVRRTRRRVPGASGKALGTPGPVIFVRRVPPFKWAATVFQSGRPARRKG